MKKTKGKIGKRIGAWLITVVLVLNSIFNTGIGMTYMQASEENGSIDIDMTEGAACSPAGAFEKCEMRYLGLEGQKLKLKLDVVLSDDYLEKTLQALIDDESNPIWSIGDDDEYGDDYLDYCDYLNNGVSESAFEPITISTTFKDAILPEGTETSGELEVLIEGQKHVIGSYTWEKVKDNSTGQDWKYTIILKNCVYSHMAFKLGCPFELNAWKPLEENETIDVDYDKSTGDFELKIRELSQEESDPAGNYSVAKTANYEEGNTYIDYKIETGVKSETNGDLRGKWIQDLLPDGLEFESVQIVKKNATNLGTPIDLSDSIDENKLCYQIVDESNKVTQLTISIRARLNEENMMNYIAENKINKSFQNSADLFRAEPQSDSESMAQSNTVTTNMQSSFFSKDGAVDGTNSKRYKWTLDVNTHSTHPVESYIIDSLDENIHVYDLSQGIEVYEKDTKTSTHLSIVQIDTSNLSEVPTYDDLNNANMRSNPQKYFDEINLSADQVGYYTYTEGEKTIGVLIIPFKQFLGKNLRIRYYTDINVSADKGNAAEQLANSAKFVYKYIQYGTGPSPYEFDLDWELNKYASIDYRIVAKTTAEKNYYNSKTQVMTWLFEVNKYRTELDELIIEDTLENAKQEYLLDGLQDIVLDNEGSRTLIPPYNASMSLEEDDYYTIEPDGSDKTKLTIHIAELKKDEYFEFEIQTKVKDTSLLTGNKSNFKIENSAVVTAVVDGEEYTQATPPRAERSISNTVLEKEKTSGYNYVDNSVGWKMTMNKDCVLIKGAAIIDNLPMGTTLLDVTKITRRDNAGNIVKTITPENGKTSIVDTTSANAYQESVTMGDGVALNFDVTTKENNSDGYLSNSMEITFGDSTTITSDTFEFEFTTAFTDLKYRYDKFEMEKVSIVNHCEYTGGTVYNEPIDAKVDAKNTLLVTPITKQGKFSVEQSGDKAGASLIEWSALINRHQVDMEGFIIEDDLKDFFELDKDSFKIYSVVLDADGAPSSKNDITGDFADQIKLTNTGFKVTIPNTHKEDTLSIEFTIYLTDDAKAANMTNSIKITSPDGSKVIETEDEKAEDAEDFDLEAYCSGASTPYIAVKKYSSNRSSDQSLFQELPGAEFTLEEVDEYGETIGGEKLRPTTVKGTQTFIFLKYNQLYKLSETKAPAGYKIPDDANIHYLYFVHADNLDNEQDIAGKDVERVVLDNEKGITYIMENDPESENSTGYVKFYKKSEDNIMLEGINFTLSRIHNGKTYTQEATSDANGLVEFDGLDPGDYILKEISGTKNKCFQMPAKTWTVTVALDENGEYGFTITGGDSGLLSKTDAEDTNYPNAYIIKNNYISNNVQLKKVNTNNTAQPVSGAEFTIYLHDYPNVVAAYMIESTVTPGTYVLSSSLSDGSSETLAKNEYGSYYLQNNKLIYGNYDLVETKTPEGYYPDNELLSAGTQNRHSFAVTATKTIYLKNSTTTAFSTTATTVFKNTPIQDGIVEFDKKTGDNIALSGITFELTNTVTNEKFTKISDTDGHVKFTEVPIGDYTLKEITLNNENAKPYAVKTGEWSVKVEIKTAISGELEYKFTITGGDMGTLVQNSTTKAYTIINDYKKGSVVLKKADALDNNVSVSGAEFTVYLAGTNTAVAYLIEDGVTGVYKLSNANGLSEQITPAVTNSRGSSYYQNGKLIYGHYEIAETTTPAGYLVDNPNGSGTPIRHTFVVDTDDSIQYLCNDTENSGKSSDTTKFVNTPENKGVIEFDKKTDDGIALSGITFELENDTTNQKYSEISDSNGHVKFSNLPLGDYTLTEIDNDETKPYQFFDETWSVTISLTAKGLYTFEITGQNEKSLSYDAVNKTYSIINYYKKGSVELYKVDSINTSKKLSGAEFSIYEKGTQNLVAYLIEDSEEIGKYILSDKNSAGEKIALPAKNERGSEFLQNGKLIYGEYDFIETIAPEDYLPDYEKDTKTLIVHHFEITENNSLIYLTDSLTNSGSEDNKEVFRNVPLYSGTVQFIKTTSDGKALKDISFKLTNKESNKSQTIVSQSDGKVMFTNLQAGDYTLEEVSDELSAPYVLTEAKWDVTIRVTDNGKNQFTITGGREGTLSKIGEDYVITNQYKMSEIILQKADSVSSSPVSGAEFTIYSNDTGKMVAYLVEDVQNPGTYILSDTNTEGTKIPDENVNERGLKYLQNQKLIYGSYYFEETITPQNYISDCKEDESSLIRHQFSVLEDGCKLYMTNDTEAAASKSVESKFNNAPVNAGKIEFDLLTEDGIPLAGIKFVLINIDTGETIAVETDENGHVVFENLPIGNYRLEESGGMDGLPFLDSRRVWNITIGLNDNREYEVEITDDVGNSIEFSAGLFQIKALYKKAAVQLTKVDTDNHQMKLHGAEFTIYVKGNENPIAYLIEDGDKGIYLLSEKNIAGEVIENPQVNELGSSYWMEGCLIYGEYEMAETVTPEGYRPDCKEDSNDTGDLNYHPFSIIEDGKTIYLNNDLENAGSTNEFTYFTNTAVEHIDSDEDKNTETDKSENPSQDTPKDNNDDKIIDKEEPKNIVKEWIQTGDKFPMFLLLFVIIVSLIGMIVVAKKIRQKDSTEK